VGVLEESRQDSESNANGLAKSSKRARPLQVRGGSLAKTLR
jgi:hypothetical protein